MKLMSLDSVLSEGSNSELIRWKAINRNWYEFFIIDYVIINGEKKIL